MGNVRHNAPADWNGSYFEGMSICMVAGITVVALKLTHYRNYTGYITANLPKG